MTTKTINTVEILPSDGMWLTQANVESDNERVFSESVYCPQGQENEWVEWTTEQKEVWEREHPIINEED